MSVLDGLYIGGLVAVGLGILLWGQHHADALLSRAEPRDRQPPRVERSDERDPTDGLWYAWRDHGGRENDDP